MSIDHGKVLALADRMERHAERLPAEAAKMLRHYIAALRALAQPAEAVECIHDATCRECAHLRKMKDNIREMIEKAWPTEAVEGAAWTPERVSRLADDCLQLAKNVEASKHDDAAQGAVADVPRWDFEQHADGQSLKLYPMRVADGRWVKWSDIQSRAFFEALVRSKEGAHPQAAPAQGDGRKWVAGYMQGANDYVGGTQGALDQDELRADAEMAQRHYDAELAAAPSQEGES